MSESLQNVTKALIDNWSLELSCELLDRNYNKNQSAYVDDSPKPVNLVALFQLLDLIVTTDELIFDRNWAFGWESSPSLNPILPMLSELEFSPHHNILVSETPDDISLLDIPDKNQQPVRVGALYYLKLAKTLGVYYWPSPQRAEFLSNYKFSKPKDGFVKVLESYVDNQMQEMIREIYAELDLGESSLDFPGFGSTILANCDSRESILPNAMQFRETKECRNFREWLQKMDTALSVGNVKTIALGLKDLKEIIKSIRAELHLDDTPDEKAELQIGISPTLTLDTRLLNSIVNPLKPKKYHMVFLRNHLMQVLTGNIWNNTARLFPELRNSQFPNQSG
jgi:hypothetical protein